MSYQGKALGAKAESWATEYLEQKKFRILKRNFRTKFGEIDILARDGQTLVIVEVKAKTSDSQGSAIEMITSRKREKLILLSHELMMKYKSENIRIDVVTID
ncbi:MAG: YraN family protein, partial [Patescibacteria group bacterium]